MSVVAICFEKFLYGTNLRILNVCRCAKLEHISELPCTIQKVDARYCFHLNRETLDMLWDQVHHLLIACAKFDMYVYLPYFRLSKYKEI
jgi:hypothetical protein